VGFFGKNSSKTSTPLRAIWLTTLSCILPGLLVFASPIAANAIFSLTAMALDLSYIIPIFCRRVFHNHPEVMFKPGPFFMGKGLLGLACNVICISWTLFICVIFSLPNVLPVTAANMNYASVRWSWRLESISSPDLDPWLQVITVGVMMLSLYVIVDVQRYRQWGLSFVFLQRLVCPRGTQTVQRTTVQSRWHT